MIKATLSNEILMYITKIDKNRYKVSEVSLPVAVESKLRKNSKKKSSYASTEVSKELKVTNKTVINRVCTYLISWTYADKLHTLSWHYKIMKNE